MESWRGGVFFYVFMLRWKRATVENKVKQSRVEESLNIFTAVTPPFKYVDISLARTPSDAAIQECDKGERENR